MLIFNESFYFGVLLAQNKVTYKMYFCVYFYLSVRIAGEGTTSSIFTNEYVN